jgi:hypothetical protein
MIAKIARMLGAATAAVALAMPAGAVLAQTSSPAGSTGCGPAAPVTQTVTIVDRDVVEFGVGERTRLGTVSQTVTYTNTYNYKGVRDLTQVIRRDDTGTTETYLAPRWLLDAYGGNLGAIIADLRLGFLKDRGPC